MRSGARHKKDRNLSSGAAKAKDNIPTATARQRKRAAPTCCLLLHIELFAALLGKRLDDGYLR